MKNLILLVILGLFSSVGEAQVMPAIPSHTILGNSSESIAAPVAITALPSGVTTTGGQTPVGTNCTTGCAAGQVAVLTSSTGNVVGGAYTVINVTSPQFSADNTGTNDAEPAIAAALATCPSSGCQIFLPSGTYRLSESLVVTGNNIHIVGTGINSTTLKCDLSVTYCLQEGNTTTAVVDNAIRDLTVTRASGTIPTNSASIYWANFNYGFELNTLATQSYYGRWIDDAASGGYLSIGYRAEHALAYNNSQSYAYIANVADVFFNESEFGHNGGETFTPPCEVTITGSANDINFNQSVILQRGPSSNTGTVLCFSNYTNTTGIITFSDVITENTAYFVSSDANTALITQLLLSNTRSSVATSFANLNAATTLQFSTLNNANIGGSVTNLSASQYVVVSGGYYQGLSITGTGSNSATVSGANLGATTLSGSFSTLTVFGNTLQSGATLTDTSTASVSKCVQLSNTLACGAWTAGAGNTNTGAYGTTVEGQSSSATGNGNMVYGTYNIASGAGYDLIAGNNAGDHGRLGNNCYAAGDINTNGDAQYCIIVMRAHGTTGSLYPTTAGGGTGSSTNELNLLSGYHAHGSVSAVCTDNTATGNVWASWDPGYFDFDYKSSQTLTGTYTSATAPTRSAGTPTGGSAMSTATMQFYVDGTHNGALANITLPTGSTDTIDCTVTVTVLQETK